MSVQYQPIDLSIYRKEENDFASCDPQSLQKSSTSLNLTRNQPCKHDLINALSLPTAILQNSLFLHPLYFEKKILGKIVQSYKNVLHCSVCTKTFDRPSLLKRHSRTHTGEKPHSCAICKKGFSTSSSLNTHKRIHTGEKPHKCLQCGKRFTASSNLYYHRMTHAKEKPHKCTLCPKSFPTPGDLRGHQARHTGKMVYQCLHCNESFNQPSTFKRHLILH